MNGRHTAVRVLFLFVVMLVQARPSLATQPEWYDDCTEYCTGGTRVHECTFEDVGYGTPLDASSVCNEFECLAVTCTQETDLNPYDRVRTMCAGWADVAGSHGLEWFTNYGCYGYDGTVEGGFYCSYLDESCPE